EKQDNMIESVTYLDPIFKIPVYSLYGEVRRPTDEMLDRVDVVLVDLQDVGCRIYTFLTTLFYMLEDCARTQKAVWVLDRPNPAGRPIEGLVLEEGWESFIGAAPVAMRHGLTLGEAAKWYVRLKNLDVDLKVIEMKGYHPNGSPNFGWPQELSWVNPSPNMPRLTTVRAYAGTVLVEGTNLSEGRGTTIPLEVIGAPDIKAEKVLEEMKMVGPHWLKGCHLRPCYFEPTFQKHQGTLCSGIQIHCDAGFYNHLQFQPYRLVALFFKCVRRLYPDYEIWRQPPYEYEENKMPIDILSGSDFLRNWVDDGHGEPEDLNKRLLEHEKQWEEACKPFLLY
ncbi:MAG: DUF1343 domain-containing protein, partial [Bdellovibrionales bacterium]|nr:DUF1343 domain-containing protein [Bdellovibrionales bacterium]